MACGELWASRISGDRCCGHVAQAAMNQQVDEIRELLVSARNDANEASRHYEINDLTASVEKLIQVLAKMNGVDLTSA